VTAGFDAGEPSGTAGRPIIGALERADVVQAVCVVSRWFGGTKLGTGGLSRAYADAARAAVELAREEGLVCPVEVLASYRIRYSYTQTAGLRRAMASLGAVELEAGYGEGVDAVLAVPVTLATSLRSVLEEMRGGGPKVERLPDRLLDWPPEGRLPSNRS
jgi:putative IMPACT (imprinted ancient) family translation regulator